MDELIFDLFQNQKIRGVALDAAESRRRATLATQSAGDLRLQVERLSSFAMPFGSFCQLRPAQPMSSSSQKYERLISATAGSTENSRAVLQLVLPAGASSIFDIPHVSTAEKRLGRVPYLASMLRDRSGTWLTEVRGHGLHLVLTGDPPGLPVDPS